uniref:Uncharacterized protein n=1 Tax=Anguilla anguilla TaxID=7936 RepID=A0A0E9XTE8_ANGAN
MSLDPPAGLQFWRFMYFNTP